LIMPGFSSKILRWHTRHGRKHLPWQLNPTPYRVWISEIMLQQTQVNTVIPYFEKFIARFPELPDLADADLDQVLYLWAGLGYYSRARNLHKAARMVLQNYHGNLPDQVATLCELPGIGRSTAGAIAAIAFGKRAAILDGNVKRVLARYYAIDGWSGQGAVNSQLWEIAETHTPTKRVAEYTQAIMDLGATLCVRKQPHCPRCPLRSDCGAYSLDATAKYPGKKPRRSLPVKQTTMFLLQNDNREILLTKRAPSGIWGGLWSFPETEQEKEVPDILQRQFHRVSTRVWPRLRHSFSHYHLEITPVHSRVRSVNNNVMESPNWLWYSLDQPPPVGLAAPVRKLLVQIAQGQSA
jgi:A/G-specific adenine glycosylase